ncbi:MAG: CDP-diacylglycerol--glycerol-3-phosphate 3-phosphatidyltransferase [bacterium]|nr:CDP-diacylglycerol--glycerol-3-phosphate 3-phosphatidyltransferase [bacterium]
MERAVPSKMLYSLPNILTYIRILAVPLLAGCFYLEGDMGKWLAVAVFALAAITDFFDGYLARAWNQQSALGRMLDPIADKLLVSVVLLMLVYDGTITGWYVWAAIIILCREILVSGLREFLAELQVTVRVTQLAKLKTTGQMVALGFLLAGSAGDKIFPYSSQLGLVILWIAAALTIYTGYDYFRVGINHVINSSK